MKEYAKGFYTGKAWRECRDAYIKSVNGLCEDCMAKGIYTPGDIVHHKIHITPKNINDASITLNFNNLRLLCIECHNKEHYKAESKRRYTVDNQGNVII